MEEIRKICEIITESPSDTKWLFKILENQDVFVKRLDAGCGRERFVILERVQ